MAEPEPQPTAFGKLFEGFDYEAYYAQHPGNREYDFGRPVGREGF